MSDSQTQLIQMASGHASRLAWALRDAECLMVGALRKDTSAEAREVERYPEEQIPARLASLIMQKADPSHNKGMTAWLVRQYVQGKLRLEDLGTANETLTMFRRYAPRLELGQRDLGQYPNLAAVWEAVIGFANAEEQHISGKAQKAWDRDKAYAESRILRQDPDGFTVAVPLTEFAAKWWGRGTRWCTAAEKNNRFWQYHKDAPLIVFVIPELKEKGKFQFWVTKGDAQFMDAADKCVSEVLITEYWPRFESVLSFALMQNGWALKWIPEELKTEEMCRIAVAQNGRALQYAPWDLRTREICRLAATQNGMALTEVPERLRTEDMCQIAVAQDGRALEHVPQKLRTEDLCRVAVGQNGLALDHVPQKLRTEEMCRIAIVQDGRAFGYVPWDLRTEEMCRIAVAQNGEALFFAPESLRTEDMCRNAVAQAGLALVAVPDVLLTDRQIWKLFGMRQRLREQRRYAEEICRIAVMQNGKILEYIPEDFRTEAMCRIAVTQHGSALKHVPEALRTQDLCQIAVAQNGWYLWAVPEKIRTEDLCRIAVAQNGLALSHVPQRLRTEALCRIAMLQNWEAWWDVPDDLRGPIRDLRSPPTPTWGLSLLDEIASALDYPTSLDLLQAVHA
jgi:exosome complex RNA-binding protein Rrp4